MKLTAAAARCVNTEWAYCDTLRWSASLENSGSVTRNGLEKFKLVKKRDKPSIVELVCVCMYDMWIGDNGNSTDAKADVRV